MDNLRNVPGSVEHGEVKTQMEIDIDGDKFIINHTHTGTRTIQEIYEDFLTRKLENP